MWRVFPFRNVKKRENVKSKAFFPDMNLWIRYAQERRKIVPIYWTLIRKWITTEDHLFWWVHRTPVYRSEDVILARGHRKYRPSFWIRSDTWYNIRLRGSRSDLLSVDCGGWIWRGTQPGFYPLQKKLEGWMAELCVFWWKDYEFGEIINSDILPESQSRIWNGNDWGVC